MTDFLRLAVANMVEDEAEGPRVILSPLSLQGFVEAIESALIATLAAGVSVEPVGYIDEMDTPRLSTDQRKIALICCGGGIQLFTLSHLQTALAAARVQENERCAKALADAGYHCSADEIRALLGKEVQS